MSLPPAMQNPNSRRRAAIDISAEILREVLVLEDAGISIVGSLQSEYPGVVRLIIAGDCLPEECEQRPLHLVSATLTTRAYGKQRIVEVEGFQVFGPIVAS